MEGECMGGQWTNFIQDTLGPSYQQEEDSVYASEAATAAAEGMSQSPFEELALEYDYEANYEPFPLFEEKARESEHEKEFMHHQQEAYNEWIDIIETEHGLDTQTRTIPDELEEPAWGFEEDQQRLVYVTIFLNKNLQHHDHHADRPQERLTDNNLDFQAAKKKKKHKPSDLKEQAAASSSSSPTPTTYVLVTDAATPPTNPPPPPASPSLPVNTQSAAAPQSLPQQQQPVKTQPPPPAVQQQPPPQPPPPVQPPAAPPQPTLSSQPYAAPGGLPGMRPHVPGGKPTLTNPNDMMGTATRSTSPKSFFETTMLPYGYATEAPSAGMPGNFGGIAPDLGRLGQIGVFSNNGASFNAHQTNSVAFFLTFLFAYIYARL